MRALPECFFLRDMVLPRLEGEAHLAWQKENSMSKQKTLGLLMALSFFLGCTGGPQGPIAGGRLGGVPVPGAIADWSFVKSNEYVDLEVRGEAPYSVTVHYYVVDGALYVEAGDNYWSRWRPMLWEDPIARVRFDDSLYPVRAVEITDPAEIAHVLPEFYEKDRDEPSAACRVNWDPEVCEFKGRFYRLDSQR